MSDLWSDRAQAYRDSATHARGDDLDLVVEWCDPGPDVTVLDVATGGGHVARRLREAGAQVVTVTVTAPSTTRPARPSSRWLRRIGQCSREPAVVVRRAT